MQSVFQRAGILRNSIKQNKLVRSFKMLSIASCGEFMLAYGISSISNINVHMINQGIFPDDLAMIMKLEFVSVNVAIMAIIICYSIRADYLRKLRNVDNTVNKE